MTARKPADAPDPEAVEEALAEAREKAEAERAAEPPTPDPPAAQGGTVTRLPSSHAARLIVDPGQTWWTEAQRAALAAVGLAEVPDGDLVAFLHLCQRSGLDPFAKEVYLIGRKDRDAPSGKKYTAQTGIDGYRHIAERTGLKTGEIGPLWCGKDGEWKEVWLLDEPPVAARFGIIRSDQAEPVWGTALYREFVPMKDEWKNNTKTGREIPSGLWGKMPAHMIAKCAEALAIRRAFPRQAAGIYVEEEMHQADIAAERKELEDAGNARARQREELVRPWGNGGPASPADTAPGAVIVGEVVGEPEAYDRDALEDELQQQARILDTTVTALARRWVAAHRKNLEDASDAELHALVQSRREEVRQAIASKMSLPDDVTAPDEPAPAAADPAPDGPEKARGSRRTAKAPETPEAGAQPATEASSSKPCTGYKPWGDDPEAPCVTCGQPKH